MAAHVKSLEVHLYTRLLARWPSQTTGSFLTSAKNRIELVEDAMAPRCSGSGGIKVKCSISGQLN